MLTLDQIKAALTKATTATPAQAPKRPARVAVSISDLRAKIGLPPLERKPPVPTWHRLATVEVWIKQSYSCGCEAVLLPANEHLFIRWQNSRSKVTWDQAVPAGLINPATPRILRILEIPHDGECFHCAETRLAANSLQLPLQLQENV